MELVLLAFAYFGGPPGADWEIPDLPEGCWELVLTCPEGWYSLRKAWRPHFRD